MNQEETFQLTGVNNEEMQKLKQSESQSNRMHQKGKEESKQQHSHQRSNPNIKNMNTTDKDKLPMLNNQKSQKNEKVTDEAKGTLKITRQRFYKLQDVLKEVKPQNKLNKTEKREIQPKKFIKIFSDKIKKKYEKLYGLQRQEKVIEELRSLEKKTFLQKELNNVEFMMEIGKKKCNQIKYEYDQRQKYLQQVLIQIDKCTQQETPQGLVDLKNMKEQQTEQLDSDLKTILYENDQLEMMRDQRKQLVMFFKKQTKMYQDILRNTNFQIKDLKSKINKYQKWKVEAETKYKIIEKLLENKDINMRTFFNDQLFDEVSEFEETRAVKEIFKNEDIIQKQHESNLAEIKRQEKLRQQLEYDKCKYHINRGSS